MYGNPYVVEAPFPPDAFVVPNHIRSSRYGSDERVVAWSWIAGAGSM